jgi:hypothetical protein
MLATIAAISYVILCLIIGLFGRNRRMGYFGTFMLSMLITPLIMMVVLAMTGPSAGVEWRQRPQRK